MNETVERIEAYIGQQMRHFDAEDRMRMYGELREFLEREYEEALMMCHFNDMNDDGDEDEE